MRRLSGMRMRGVGYEMWMVLFVILQRILWSVLIYPRRLRVLLGWRNFIFIGKHFTFENVSSQKVSSACYSKGFKGSYEYLVPF